LKGRYYDLVLQLDARKERESDWNRQNMTELTHLRLRQAKLKKIEKNLQQRRNLITNPLTDEDLEEIVNERHRINILIKELETEKK
jgi:nickel-dependent lactate racemase